MSRVNHHYLINDIPQFIGYRGKGPIPILFIHGGPGASMLPSARRIARTTTLEQDFTLIYWEQRGTGLSLSKTTKVNLSLKVIIDDAIKVASYIEEKFCIPPIVVGHSWGTIVGLHLTAKRPDLVQSYVGIGQVVNVLAQEIFSTNWLLSQVRKQRDTVSERRLRKLGASTKSAANMLEQRKILARYGGIWKGKGYFGLLATEIADYITTQEYGPKELWQVAHDPAYSLRALFADKLTVDLPAQITKLKKPVTFVAGRHDQITPIHLVRKFAKELNNERSIRVVEFAESAHYAHLEEPAKFENVIRDAVRWL